MESNPKSRRKRTRAIQAETLETRSLMTGGVGNTFAINSTSIDQADQVKSVEFTLDKGLFTRPTNRIVLGVDVAPGQNSSATPIVVGITDAAGKNVKGLTRVYMNNATSRKSIDALSSSTTTEIKAPGNASQTFKVTVGASGKTTGTVLVGYYLPGDANGDGTVDATDAKAIKSLFGKKTGDTAYAFEADANRDGIINKIDYKLAVRNFGVKTLVTPVVSANFDPEPNGGAQNRTTTQASGVFTGDATPGASITYTEVNGKATPVATSANTAGKYQVTIPLAEGSNTFRVTIADGFGQKIDGNIAAVTYNKALTTTTDTTKV